MNTKTGKDQWCTCALSAANCEMHVKPRHTPTPWRYNKNTYYIEDANGELVLNCCHAIAGDGDVIGRVIRAVNAHEALIEALDYCLDRLSNREQLDDETFGKYEALLIHAKAEGRS